MVLPIATQPRLRPMYHGHRFSESRAMKFSAYSSRWLAELAQKACSDSRGDGKSAITAVVFSVAWLEAYVNEVVYTVLNLPIEPEYGAVVRLSQVLSAAESSGRNENLLRRIRLIGTVLSDAPVDIGQSPWQDLAVLIAIRNSLIHNRPESFEIERAAREPHAPPRTKQYPRQVVELLNRGLLDQPTSEVFLTITGSIQVPAVADWAYKTAKAAVLEIARWFPHQYAEHSMVKMALYSLE
jgi:hypothetical protein